MDDYFWDGQCHDQATYITKSLKDNYKWNLKGKWTVEELRRMIQTAYDIQNYVNELTGGKGLEWMNRNMSDILIAHSSDAPFWLPNDRNTNFPGWISGTGENTIYLTSGFTPADFAHELAEQWDLHSSNYSSPFGYIGGVADSLNLVEGGNIWSSPFGLSRWWNNYDTNFAVVAPGNLFNVSSYANTSSEDYLAEAFSTMIYPDSQQFSSGMPTSAEYYIKLWIMYSNK